MSSELKYAKFLSNIVNFADGWQLFRVSRKIPADAMSGMMVKVSSTYRRYVWEVLGSQIHLLLRMRNIQGLLE